MNSSIIADINLTEIEVLKQIWKSGERFSYEKKSRPFWGICYVLSSEIKYDEKTQKYP